MPTKEQMHEYGYTWDGMIPISEDEVEELYDEYELFLLYPDNTEAVIVSREEIHTHAKNGGMFGIKRRCK